MNRAAPVALLFLFALPFDAGAAPKLPEPTWAKVTASPTPPSTLSNDQALALAKCGRPEAGLIAVAQELAAGRRSGSPLPEAGDISFRMRRAGEPHVWPNAWASLGGGGSFAETVAQIDTWVRASSPLVGEARCGVGIARTPEGLTSVVALRVDAVADLAPVPVFVRTGQWVTLSAHVNVRASGGHIVIVGPDGAPWTPPSSFDRGAITSRFAPPRPGAYSLQFLAETVNGPRPVLELRLFADVEPPHGETSDVVPGEERGAGASDDADMILKMTNGLREKTGRSQLVRDARLDALAIQHAQAMVRTHTIGHDVGDGSPDARVRRAGIAPRTLGENVAHSDSTLQAHRSLYASISHRENLLHPDFARMGVGVIHDADGTIWVAELFASVR